MKIKYAFLDGTVTEVEVSDEIGAVIIDSRKAEHAQDERHRYHCYSYDAIDYEGEEYGACDEYAVEDDSAEQTARIREYVNGTSGRIRSAKTVLSPDGSHRQRRYITCFRCPAAGRTMKKTSVRSAVPVTTRDTSHSVTDDGTVGLCHAAPQGEVKSLRPFPLGNGEGSREQKKRIQTQKIKEINRKDETIMAKDGTSRGGARPGAGRKPKAITEKVADGNPGGRKLTVVDFGENAAELTGEEMPPVSEFITERSHSHG